MNSKGRFVDWRKIVILQRKSLSRGFCVCFLKTDFDVGRKHPFGEISNNEWKEDRPSRILLYKAFCFQFETRQLLFSSWIPIKAYYSLLNCIHFVREWIDASESAWVSDCVHRLILKSYALLLLYKWCLNTDLKPHVILACRIFQNCQEWKTFCWDQGVFLLLHTYILYNECNWRIMWMQNSKLLQRQLW